MSNVWPPSLPQRMGRPVLSRSASAVVRFAADVGPGKVRRRTTAAVRLVGVQVELTGAQLATFRSFWAGTIDYGADTFEWNDPETGSVVEYRFTAEPDFSLVVGADLPANRVWRATLALEILPTGEVTE